MSPARDRQRTLVSGPDAYGPRRVLRPASGATLLPAGTCPGCGDASHLGLTCHGLTSDQVIAELRRSPATVSTDGLRR